MDIDEILKMAETQDSDPEMGGVAQDLLQQFKVHSLSSYSV